MKSELSLGTLLFLAGCAANADPSGGAPDLTPAPTASTGGQGGGAGSAPLPDAGPGPSPDAMPGAPEVVGHLTGTVWAPNGTVPIAGALLYLTSTAPEPIADHVYCDSCVKLAAGTPYALSDSSGHFDLSATATGKQFLVIQKGGFRRVREIYVSKGDLELPNTLTLLPPKTNLAQGDEIPRLTVVRGAYDEIEASLQKLGIDADAIDIVWTPLIGEGAKAFLTDAKAVNSRHIVFLPCGDFTQPSPNVDLSSDPTIQKNLKSFVDAGGRLYVTDWHYDFIARTFPGFVSFEGASSTACSGCGHLPYDAPAEVKDGELASWMTAQGLSSFTLQKNYTAISSVSPNATTDAQGNPATITPHVWVNGQKQGTSRPATVSFESGCGRVLFSTYHTEPFSLELTPQERALLGVLLEVSVCTESPSGVIVK